VNVLLHSASVILLFLALLDLTGNVGPGIGDAGRDQRNFWRSAFVAAIFAIHPLHVESVAWISERKDVLSGLFFMLTLLAYARYARRPTITRYTMVTVLFGCGLLSKPMLVTMPVILLLLDFWPLRRLGSSEAKRQEQRAKGKAAVVSPSRDLSALSFVVVEKVPLLLLAIGSAIATLIAQRGGILEMAQLPFSWRIGNAATVYLIYIGQMFWPVNLAAIYPHPGRLPFWQIAAACVSLIVVVGLVLVGRKRAPYLVTGWFWYLIMLIPVVGLVQVGSQAHADRYTYLSEIGIYIALVWGVTDLLQPVRYRREIFASASLLIIVALGWRAWIQTGFWHDTERLWNRTIAVTGENDFAHFALGEYLLKVHRLDDAIAQFETVLPRHPKDPDMNFQMGCALMEKGETGRAIQTAVKFKPRNSDAETNLGNVLLKSDRVDEAVEHYRNVVAYDPSSPRAHYNLAVGLHRLGRFSEAVAQYKDALALDPNYPDAKEFLQQALLESGQGDQSNSGPEKH
jgi:protein O-mannosyl-transferase